MSIRVSSGKLYLTLVRLAAYFYCDGSLLLTRGQKLAYGAAIAMEVPIRNGKISFAGRSNDLSAVTGKAEFNADKVTGSLVGYAALFAGSKVPPSDFEAKSCRTENLTFTAALSKPNP